MVAQGRQKQQQVIPSAPLSLYRPRIAGPLLEPFKCHILVQGGTEPLTLFTFGGGSVVVPSLGSEVLDFVPRDI